MKVAIFYEGESEEEMLKAFFRNYCYNFKLIEDIAEFRQQNDNCVLLYPCGGYQNVFPLAEKNIYLYRGHTLLLVRDLEKTPCFTELKREAAQLCSYLSIQVSKATQFAAPNLEFSYAADLNRIQDILKYYWRKTYGHSNYSNDFLNDLNRLNLATGYRAIEFVSRKYSIGYRKREGAEKFFSTFDFSASTHPYFVRLRDFFAGGVCDGLP